MSKLYVVVMLACERHYDYKHKEIRASVQPCVPFVFDRYDRAIKEAEKKRKSGVPTFVSEFPFNPLDNRMDSMAARMKSDAEYISELEQLVKKLEELVKELREENTRLRSCLSDDAENARLLLGEVHELVALANRLGMMFHECYCVEKDKAFCDGECTYGVDDETCEITKAMDVLEKYGRV